MSKAARLATLVALVSVVAITPAVGDEATWAREANDRAEIRALMARYAHALDTLDVDAYVEVFAEDAQFGDARGHDAIRELISRVKAARERNLEPGESVTPTYQSLTNMTIEFLSEDRARVEGYYMAIFGATEDSPPRVATVGREVDEVVRVDGQWLIALRSVSP